MLSLIARRAESFWSVAAQRLTMPIMIVADVTLELAESVEQMTQPCRRQPL